MGLCFKHFHGVNLFKKRVKGNKMIGSTLFSIFSPSPFMERGPGGEVRKGIKRLPLPIGRAIHGDTITFRIDIIYILPSPDIGIGFIGI